MRPRDRLEMLADIVEFLITTGPQNQTRIMQACNLRYDQEIQCLNELLQSKLIEKDEGSNVYRTTQLGIDFLKRWTGIFQEFLVGHEKKKHFWTK
ncbi:MAG TPA: winged helix-turn-helix domain-containing protein [Candidatus Bathyarchaeia archaeon]|nr:winged helix-turn-helix domain-containing protein [Candidatus Bathyarchaeia archaeon]